ncbi:MAG: serine--tRNA ligase, partial [Candidatus Cloacimonadota bacterium]
MLDLKFIREHRDTVKAAVRNKNEKADIEKLLTLDENLRGLQKELDALRHIRNTVSKEIAQVKRSGKEEPEKVKEMRKLSLNIKGKEKQKKEIKNAIDEILIWVPNIPHATVPVGKDASANKVMREVKGKNLPFDPLPHWKLAENCNLVDFRKGSKVSGSNFPFYTECGARLERALINFMIDTHSANGYKEVFTPFLVSSDAMFGTG